MRFADGILEGFRVDYFCAFHLRFDFGGRGANGVDPLHALSDQVIKNRVVATLIFAAENQVNIRRE